MKNLFAICLTSAAILTGYQPAMAATLNVQVVDASGRTLGDAAVYAEPLAPSAPGHAREAEIEQKSRKFMPIMTVVQTGAQISFPNNDTVRHHVYSFSPTKPFELKLYSGTPGSPILFDKPGTVVIGCNIHDQMVAYIQVVNTPYFGKSDDTGHVRIAGLPPGKYRLKAWHYQLPPSSPPVENEIAVTTNDVTAKLVVATKSMAGAH